MNREEQAAAALRLAAETALRSVYSVKHETERDSWQWRELDHVTTILHDAIYGTPEEALLKTLEAYQIVADEAGRFMETCRECGDRRARRAVYTGRCRECGELERALVRAQWTKKRQPDDAPSLIEAAERERLLELLNEVDQALRNDLETREVQGKVRREAQRLRR